ncbi:MAG TPA: hypothetical protein PKC67_02450 [Kiritimatiellia bacterium]|nr:hypothetical protein [Kiritimatiellia bacterium]HMP33186.1 hypothetical protein [Kiritimatiellia bacterium]
MSTALRRIQAVNIREAHFWFGKPIKLPRNVGAETRAVRTACDHLHGFFQVIMDTSTHEVTPESYCQMYERDLSPTHLRALLDAWRTGRLEKLREIANENG